MFSVKKCLPAATAVFLMLCAMFFANAEEDCGYIVKLSDQAVTLMDVGFEYDPLASLGFMAVPDENTAAEMVENGFAVEYHKDAPVELLTESWQPVDSAYDLQYAPKQMNAEQVWKMGYYGEGITVAIVDSGANSHVDLDDRIIHKYSVFTKDDVVTDSHGHGTHVAGIACGGINGKCIVGIAPKCNIAIIKSYTTSGNGMSKVAAGIAYAVDVVGADVINVSMGGESSTAAIEAAIKKAEEKGVVVCAAVGNNGNITSALMYPAALENVIGVGAVESTGVHFELSRGNESVDIMAGGRTVYSCSYSGIDSHTYKSGTSMASPAVAGAVALLLSADPTLTPAQVRKILQETATDLGEKGYDTAFGHGLVNVEKAVKSVIDEDVHVSDLTEFTVNGVTKEYFSVFNNTDKDFSVSAASYTNGKMTYSALRNVKAGQTEKFSRIANSGQSVKLMFLKDFLSFSPFRLPHILG